jgi:hypothetical protein
MFVGYGTFCRKRCFGRKETALWKCRKWQNTEKLGKYKVRRKEYLLWFKQLRLFPQHSRPFEGNQRSFGFLLKLIQLIFFKLKIKVQKLFLKRISVIP